MRKMGLPCIQKSHSGSIYIAVGNDDIKIQKGDFLAHHVTQNHQHQVPSHPVKKQQVNRSYGRRMLTQSTAGTPDNSEPTAAGQIITLNDRDVGSSGDDSASNAQQHLNPYKHLVHDTLLSQDVITTEEVTGETQEMNPMSFESSMNQLPQHLLEDYADFIDTFLIQSDFTNEIFAFGAVLKLDTF
jgi:hypothetical protein